MAQARSYTPYEHLGFYTHYDYLSIPHIAYDCEIRQAYSELLSFYRPGNRDHYIGRLVTVEGRPLDTEYFIKIQDAYRTLSNPGARKDYDYFLEVTNNINRMNAPEKKKIEVDEKNEAEQKAIFQQQVDQTFNQAIAEFDAFWDRPIKYLANGVLKKEFLAEEQLILRLMYLQESDKIVLNTMPKINNLLAGYYYYFGVKGVRNYGKAKEYLTLASKLQDSASAAALLEWIKIQEWVANPHNRSDSQQGGNWIDCNSNIGLREVQSLTSLAEVHNNIWALIYLGLMHQSSSRGYPRHTKIAVEYFEKAAERGSCVGLDLVIDHVFQSFGGLEFEDVRRVRNSDLKYEAVKKGSPKALFLLGKAYVKVDLSKAAICYRKSAEKGVKEAREELLKLAQHSGNPSVIYHSTILTFEPEMIENFNRLAVINPNVFDELCLNESQATLQSLLIPHIANSVLLRRQKLQDKKIRHPISEAMGSPQVVGDLIASFLLGEKYITNMTTEDRIKIIIKFLKENLQPQLKAVASNSNKLDSKQQLFLNLCLCLENRHADPQFLVNALQQIKTFKDRKIHSSRMHSEALPFPAELQEMENELLEIKKLLDGRAHVRDNSCG